jgi:hypothetical protein
MAVAPAEERAPSANDRQLAGKLYFLSKFVILFGSNQFCYKIRLFVSQVIAMRGKQAKILSDY